MNILALHQEDSACCYHRVFLPFNNFPLREGDRLVFKDTRDIITDEDFEEVDIVVYNRIPPVGLTTLIAYRRTFGFKIVCDIDDWWELPDNHHLKARWTLGNTPARFVDNIRAADVVTCTNESLKSKIFPLNKNCEVLPNALPYGAGQFTSEKDASEKVRVIYTGGPSHLHDLKTIGRFFESIANDPFIKKDCEVILAGVTGSPLWEKIIKVVRPTRILMNKNVTEYMDHYRQADISVAPLEKNSFTECKSTLKLAEAGTKKIPLLATNTLPYSVDKNCEGLILCNNNREWITNLKTLVKDQHYRQELGTKTFEYCSQNYNLATVNEKRYELLKGVVQ